MVTKHDSASWLPKRKLTTYAKTSRKRQSKTPYQSAATDDDPTHKPTTKATTTARRQFAPASTPTPRSPSPESGNLVRTGKRRLGEAMIEKDLKLDRKRKFSQVSPTAQPEKQTRSQQDSSPSALAATDTTPSSRLSSNQRPRMRSASSEDADIDMIEARLSSPPPTPTRSKMPVAAVRANTKADMPFSPNTMQLWDNLLDSEEENIKETKHRHREIPVRPAPKSNPKSRPQEAPSRVAGTNHQRGLKAATSNLAATLQSKPPRRRLIDALVEQAAANTDEAAETSDDSVELSQALSSQISSTPMHGPVSVPSTLAAQPAATQTKGNLFTRPAFTPKPQALARTYGQGTKVLQEDEEDMLFEAFDLPESASHSLKGKRLELRGPRKWSNAGDLADDEDALVGSSPNTKIRDIHELRQAGASTRVADEMQDLAEQIGIPASKPSSSRRAALLRIAEEIKNKDFIRQFRDHGIDAVVFKDIGRETDVISAYLILSTLVTMLSKWPSPHTIRLLQEEEIGIVLARLLRCHDSMKKVVQDRKNNLSRRNQNAVLDIQKYLRELSIWGSGKPTTVTPRSLSIKCLHLLVTQEPRLGRDSTTFSESVTEALLTIISEATAETDYLNYPENDGSIDLCNTLSVLDFHAVDMASSDRGDGRWSNNLLPIVTDVFGAFLRSPSQKDKTLETSILKLTINLTNNNLNAPDICIAKGLVPALAGSICSNFSQILTEVSQDKWPEGILDGLVLRLGILINFLEHSVGVRQVTYECQYEGFRPIDEFIQLFLENYRRTAEADSVEKSHLNVVFGYLAVLLGHLCLYAPARHKFRSSHAAKSMGPLLESIREFVHHHKTMESQIYEGEDGPHGQSGWAEIEALARQLEDEAAYD